MSCHDCVNRMVSERADGTNHAQLNRREFIADSVGLAVLAAAIAACGDGTVSGVVDPVPEIVPGVDQVTIRVADFPGLATIGTLVKVSSFFAAKRLGPSTFDAFSMACTHEGTLLNIVDGQRFDCPAHGSRFDANGAVVNGPAERPLMRLVTSYDPVTDELTIN